MKKTILMGIAALMLCGTVNATSWRVCSKPETGASFTSVYAAVTSFSVQNGDTLYLEPGHYEPGDVAVSKSLTVIGPGYFFEENTINVLNPACASLRGIRFDSINSSISGCVIYGNLDLFGANCCAKSCAIKRNSFQDIAVDVRGANNILQQCYIRGRVRICTSTTFGTAGNAENSTIQNNIINGKFIASGVTGGLTIRNNVVVDDDNNSSFYDSYQECTFPSNSYFNSNIYNNIIIRIDNRFYTVTTNQAIDTFYSKDYIFPADFTTISNNSVYNNILSCKNNSSYLNCVFNTNVDDVLIWNDANTLEEKYKHKANGPAVGAGVNGTTCGAYGVVNGSRAYQPAGIPQYRPYIYDAQIDETPSSNNTINASFKIKVQQ